MAWLGRKQDVDADDEYWQRDGTQAGFGGNRFLPEKLVELGAKAAYARLKAAYPRVCLVHLYSLEGAVTNTEYNALSEEKRKELKTFSDSLKGIEKQTDGGQ